VPRVSATVERRAHFPLELADLQAEGRLLDAEALGCAPEMQFFGDRDELTEMPVFHGPTTGDERGG
jgi:hypothetical protein